MFRSTSARDAAKLATLSKNFKRIQSDRPRRYFYAFEGDMTVKHACDTNFFEDVPLSTIAGAIEKKKNQCINSASFSFKVTTTNGLFSFPNHARLLISIRIGRTRGNSFRVTVETTRALKMRSSCIVTQSLRRI